jgi:hypothetical protein
MDTIHMDALRTVGQWSAMILGAWCIFIVVVVNLVRRFRPGRGMPTPASLGMSIAFSAMGLGLWFTAAFTSSPSLWLAFLTMLTLLVSLCGATIALILILMARQAG